MNVEVHNQGVSWTSSAFRSIFRSVPEMVAEEVVNDKDPLRMEVQIWELSALRYVVSD